MLQRTALWVSLACACQHAPEWKPAPATYPAGTELAAIEGNPKEAGPFVLQARFPAGAKLKPHRHPAAEHTKVLSGSWNVGFGEAFDQTKTERHAAGESYVIPQGEPHFGWSDEGAVLEVHADGPWGSTFVEAQ